MIPARCALFVRVAWPGSPVRYLDAVVEPTTQNCAKKNVLVPRAAISVVQGQSQLWTVNYSSEPVMLPRGLNVAHGTKYTSTSIAVLTEESGPSVHTHPMDSSKLLNMINKSLEQDERRALVDVLSKHAGVFDFSQLERCPVIPATRTHHTIHTGGARPIRQKTLPRFPVRATSNQRASPGNAEKLHRSRILQSLGSTCHSCDKKRTVHGDFAQIIDVSML